MQQKKEGKTMQRRHLWNLIIKKYVCSTYVWNKLNCKR